MTPDRLICSKPCPLSALQVRQREHVRLGKGTDMKRRGGHVSDLRRAVSASSHARRSSFRKNETGSKALVRSQDDDQRLDSLSEKKKEPG